jgi:hypothetical protein
MLIMPKTGDILELKTAKGISEKCSFSEDEQKKLEFKQANGNITWNKQSEVDTEIELTAAEQELIRSILIKMNKEKSLTADDIPLWDKFQEVQ